MTPGLAALEARLLLPLRRATEEATARLGLTPDLEREGVDEPLAPAAPAQDAAAPSAGAAPLQAAWPPSRAAIVDQADDRQPSAGRAAPPADDVLAVSAALSDGLSAGLRAVAPRPAAALAGKLAPVGGPALTPPPAAQAAQAASPALPLDRQPAQVAHPAPIARQARWEPGPFDAASGPPPAAAAPSSSPSSPQPDGASAGQAAFPLMAAPSGGAALSGSGAFADLAAASPGAEPASEIVERRMAGAAAPAGAPFAAIGASQEPFAGLLPVRAVSPAAPLRTAGGPAPASPAPSEAWSPAPAGLADPALDRVVRAMQPTLSHAADLAEASFAGVDDDVTAAPSIRNTFNVNVALSAQIGSAERCALQDALTDLLRDAARRQGLDL